MGATAEQRSLAGKTAAYTSWAHTEDRLARTAPGTKAFLDSFERKVDPDGRLDPADRARRAESLRKAHMSRIALLSVKSRQRAAEARRLSIDPNAPAFTVAEAAVVLGATLPTVYAWVKDGTLPKVPGDGRAMKVSGAAVRALKAEREGGPDDHQAAE